MLWWQSIVKHPRVFLSYCWSNSKDAVEKGTKDAPGSLGWGDPRKIKTFLDVHSKERKTSIMPVFDISGQNVVLNNIYTIVANDRFEPQIINKKVNYNLFLFKNDQLYKLFYKSHIVKKSVYRSFQNLLKYYNKFKNQQNGKRLTMLRQSLRKRLWVFKSSTLEWKLILDRVEGIIQVSQ